MEVIPTCLSHMFITQISIRNLIFPLEETLGSLAALPTYIKVNLALFVQEPNTDLQFLQQSLIFPLNVHFRSHLEYCLVFPGSTSVFFVFDFVSCFALLPHIEAFIYTERKRTSVNSEQKKSE